MQNNEIISTEEIKHNILFSLEKNGILENLKAYLRSNIYSNLKEKEDSLPTHKTPPNLKIDLKDSDYEKIKTLKITISLIADFFKKMEFSYTYSVFVPEIRKLIKDELYSECELSKIFEISSDNNQINLSSSYFSILNHIISQRSSKFSKKSTHTQTETEEIPLKSFTSKIDEKFKEIDLKYSKNISLENLMPAKSIEEKMLKFQRDYELRHKEDLEREIKRIKEIELSQIRIEENRKYLKKIDEVREEYEKEYHQKFEYLKKKEIEVNFRINQKEKELETQIYESRQKFLNQLESLKRKDEELGRKYETDVNKLKLEEEKLKFKQKEIDYLKESSDARIKEEIEQFKLEYNRMFEIEKKEFHKKKMEFEERDFRNNLLIEKIKNWEDENFKLKEEKENFCRELKELSHLNASLKKEIQSYKDDLKSSYENDKRKSDFFGKLELENSHLKEEIKFLKESLEIHKKSSEERKSDQMILIENLKIQLNENFKRFENNKDHLEREIQNLKKYYHSSIELEERVKILENQKVIQENEHKVLIEKYNQLLKKNSEMKKKNLNKIINMTNQENFAQFSKTAKVNNFVFENKTPFDRFGMLSKLEKEQEEIKNEFKRSFIENSRSREGKFSYPLQIPDSIENIYTDLNENINLEKFQFIDNVRIRNFLESKKKNILQNKESEFIIEKEMIETEKKNNLIYHKSEIPNRKKEVNNKSQEISNLSYNRQSNTSVKSLNNENPMGIKLDNPDTIDKLSETIIQQEKEQDKYNYQVNEKEKEQKKIQMSNFNNDFKEKDKNNSSTLNYLPQEKIENKLDEELRNEEIINDGVECKPEVFKEFKKTEKINQMVEENELDNIQKEVEPLSGPIIISEINIQNNICKEPSERLEIINEISIANITSSNEWENESHKNKSSRGDLNKFNQIQFSNNTSKLISDKINPVIIPTQIKKEESPTEIQTPLLIKTENISENVNKLHKDYSESSDIKEEFSSSGNKNSIYEFDSNKKLNDIKPPQLIKNQSEIENKLQSNFNKFSSFNFALDNNEIEDEIKTEQNESENYEYDFVEDVDGLEKKASIDIDAINKNISFTNNSNNHNNRNKMNNKSIMKSQSMEKYIDKLIQSKVSNTDDNIAEEISYENSKKEELITANTNSIEEDSALKYNDYYLSNNYNQVKSIQETHSENIYNDYYQSNPGLNSVNSYSMNQIRNIAKDSSKDISQKFAESKRTSDIREEIIDEDAYEPIYHDDY